jgi:methoxymalonate biosynthesis acyl carrier protein
MTVDPRTAIGAFLTSSFPNITVGEEDDIFELGIANSLFTLQLIMFIEKQFEVKIPNEALELDNFRTIAAMSKLVRQLTETSPHV